MVEQEQFVRALEESFLEGGAPTGVGDGAGEGKAGDREVAEFLKRYREGVKTLVLRGERRARWDEGRVGGWR